MLYKTTIDIIHYYLITRIFKRNNRSSWMFKFDYRNFTEGVCYFKNTLLKELSSTHVNLRNVNI